jgi:hypothetical protein
MEPVPKRGRGRPPLGDLARDGKVSFRLSVTDTEVLVRLAEEQGTSPSLVARDIVEQSLRSQDTD